jgi:hypothetical protein
MKIYQYAIVIPTKDGGAPTKGLAGAVWDSPEFKEALGKHYDSLIFNGKPSSIILTQAVPLLGVVNVSTISPLSKSPEERQVLTSNSTMLPNSPCRT